MKKFIVISVAVFLFVTGCNSDGPQKDFYSCNHVVAMAHPEMFAIDDIRGVMSEDITYNTTGVDRRVLSQALASDGASYPVSPSYDLRGSLLVTWKDKEGKLHVSIVQKGKEILTAPLVISAETEEKK